MGPKSTKVALVPVLVILLVMRMILIMGGASVGDHVCEIVECNQGRAAVHYYPCDQDQKQYLRVFVYLCIWEEPTVRYYPCLGV